MVKIYNKQYDDGGAVASTGTVSQALMDYMMNDEFVRRHPPKSTGREVS